MALINHATKEITAKIVYYGPGLCGKTTNLQWIHGKVPIKNKGKLVSLATESDRTLFFDYLPIEIGMVRGMKTRIGLYTVPGQVFYEATRRMVLKGADAVVFVADSQKAALDANLESLASLRQNLLANDLDPSMPMVFQYNKRDLPAALAVEALNRALNPRGLPFFEAVAVQGVGVEETLKAITADLFKYLTKFYESTPAPLKTGDTGKFKAVAPPPPTPRPSDSGRFRAVAPPGAPAPGKPGETGRFKVTPPPAATPSAPAPAKPAEARPGDSGRFRVPAPAHPAAPAPAKPAEVRAGDSGRLRVPAPAAPAAPPRPQPPPQVEAPVPAPTPPPAPATRQGADATPPKGVPVVTRAPSPTPPAPAARDPGATPPKGTPAIRPEPRPTPPPAAATEPEPVFFQQSEPRPTPPPPVARPAAVPAPSLEDLREGQWLYLQDGKHKGPVSLDDLVDLILDQRLPDSTLVYGHGLERWTRASQVPDIADQIPPPLPETRPEPSGRPADFPEFANVPAMLRTVLIADENPEFRRFLGLPLLAQGFRVWEAGDGGEAWRLALQHRPWLILSDAHMPEIDGFEVCRRVRVNSLLSHTPFLFISGSDNYKDRLRGKQVGADDFLSKMTPMRELLIRIKLLLETKYADLQKSPSKEAGGEEGGGAAMEGQVEILGAPSALQICNQGRFTGTFVARAAGRSVDIRFRDGEIVAATTEGHTGAQAVYDFLAWSSGHFRFVPGDPGEGAPIAQSVEHLLLEGCRLLDETRRSDEP